MENYVNSGGFDPFFELWGVDLASMVALHFGG